MASACDVRNERKLPWAAPLPKGVTRSARVRPFRPNGSIRSKKCAIRAVAWACTSSIPRRLAVIHESLFDGEQLDGLYRGCQKGVRLVAVTNRRLMMVETTSCEDRLALTSVPFDRVTSVSYLASTDKSVAYSTTVGILVQEVMYELGCRGEEQARELHDLIAWQLVCG